jgi:hypothetical protein
MILHNDMLDLHFRVIAQVEHVQIAQVKLPFVQDDHLWSLIDVLMLDSFKNIVLPARQKKQQQYIVLQKIVLYISEGYP